MLTREQILSAIDHMREAVKSGFYTQEQTATAQFICFNDGKMKADFVIKELQESAPPTVG